MDRIEIGNQIKIGSNRVESEEIWKNLLWNLKIGIESILEIWIETQLY
jgi:hypothetical protein